MPPVARVVLAPLRSTRRNDASVSGMFILGVGAQKGGTSWLWRQVQKHKAYKGLGRKELHYWDSFYGLHGLDISDESGIVSHFTDTDSSKWNSSDHDRYFDRIAQALDADTPNSLPTRITADITPAYAGLSRFVLNNIAQELKVRAIEYRIVYLLRDPVERVISAINFKIKRAGTRDDPKRSTYLSPEFLIKYARSWPCQMRTRYELTLDNLHSAFPYENVFVGLQERISDRKQQEGLAAHLGYPADEIDSEEKWNVGTSFLVVSEKSKEAIAQIYEKTYVEIATHKPEVKSLWPNYQYL